MTVVAHDTRFAFMHARVCLYNRVLTHAAICVTACRERSYERWVHTSEMKYFYVYRRRYRWICGVPSNATGRKRPRVRLMYRPVTIINVLSTSCYDKLLRWTDMGSFKYTPMLLWARCSIQKQIFSKWRAKFLLKFYSEFWKYAANNRTYTPKYLFDEYICQ